MQSTSKETSKAMIIISIFLITIIVISIGVPVFQSNNLGNYQGNERQFGEYALQRAEIENFENPLQDLLIFNTKVAAIEMIESNKSCGVILPDGLATILSSTYRATIIAQTFFGFTLDSAIVECERGEL